MTDKQKYIIRKSSEKIHEIRNMLNDALGDMVFLEPDEYNLIFDIREEIDIAGKKLQTINTE